MMKLTSKHLYESHPAHYEALSDFIYNNKSQVPLLGVTPELLVEVSLEDCYLDDEGNFFSPNFYNWTYKGSNSEDDPDEYSPVYDPSTPTLTKLEVANLVATVEEPDLNNPANHAN
jgi:hypothetical protein